MRIFGREPAAWVGLIEAVLAMTVVMGIVTFTAEQTALVMAAVVALFGLATAYYTKDAPLGVIVGAAKAVLALAVGFGAALSPEVTASIIAVVTVAVGFFQRTQTSPATTPAFASEG